MEINLEQTINEMEQAANILLVSLDQWECTAIATNNSTFRIPFKRREICSKSPKERSWRSARVT